MKATRQRHVSSAEQAAAQRIPHTASFRQRDHIPVPATLELISESAESDKERSVSSTEWPRRSPSSRHCDAVDVASPEVHTAAVAALVLVNALPFPASRSAAQPSGFALARRDCLRASCSAGFPLPVQLAFCSECFL